MLVGHGHISSEGLPISAIPPSSNSLSAVIPPARRLLSVVPRYPRVRLPPVILGFPKPARDEQARRTASSEILFLTSACCCCFLASAAAVASTDAARNLGSAFFVVPVSPVPHKELTGLSTFLAPLQCQVAGPILRTRNETCWLACVWEAHLRSDDTGARFYELPGLASSFFLPLVVTYESSVRLGINQHLS